MAEKIYWISSFVEQGSTPSTPATGFWKLYPKSDGWYSLDDTGAEVKVGAATGTTNYLAKFGASGLTDSVVFDNGTNIGIGTTSPGAPLHIVAPIESEGSGNAIQIIESSVGGTRTWLSAQPGYANQLEFLTGGVMKTKIHSTATGLAIFYSNAYTFRDHSNVQHLEVDSSGNVNVGGTTATHKFYVRDTTAPVNTAKITDSSNSWGLTITEPSAANMAMSLVVRDDVLDLVGSGSGGTIKMRTTTYGNEFRTASGWSGFTMTTAPTGSSGEQGLLISHTPLFGDNVAYFQSALNIQVNSSSTSHGYVNGIKVQKATFTNPNMVFYPGIFMDGNVGVGITQPTAKLHVYDITNSGTKRLYIEGYDGNSGVNNTTLHVKSNTDASSTDIIALIEHLNYNGSGSLSGSSILRVNGGFGTRLTTALDVHGKGYVTIGNVWDGTNKMLNVTYTDTNTDGPGSEFGNNNTYAAYISSTKTVSGQASNKFGLYVESIGNYVPQTTQKNYGLYVNVSSGSGAASDSYAAIFTGGNVGVGDTSPAEKITIGAGHLFLSSTGYGIKFADSPVAFPTWTQATTGGGRLTFTQNGNGDIFYIYGAGNSDSVPHGAYLPGTGSLRVGGSAADWDDYDNYTKVLIKTINSGNTDNGLRIVDSTLADVFKVNSSGEVTALSLAGSGTRSVNVDSTGKLVAGSAIGPGKYSEAGTTLTAGTPYTVTHNLGTTMIQIALWSVSAGDMVGFAANNRTSNSVDIVVTVDGDYDIVVVG